MAFRQYDPAIARWTSVDPVTHFSMSTYTGFDNNPVYWSDPSGANSEGYFGMYDLEWGGYMMDRDDPDYSDEGQSYGYFMIGGNEMYSVVDLGIIKNKRPFPFEGLQDSVEEFEEDVSDALDPTDWSHHRGIYLEKLWEKWGYFEIGGNTVKGKSFQLKINKAYAVEISPDKQIPHSWSYNNRDGSDGVKYGVENNPKSWEMGFGVVSGGSMSITENPDGTKELAGGLAHKAVTVEGVLSKDSDDSEPTGGCTHGGGCNCDGTSNLPITATPLIGEGGFVSDDGIAMETLPEIVVTAPKSISWSDNNRDFINGLINWSVYINTEGATKFNVRDFVKVDGTYRHNDLMAQTVRKDITNSDGSSVQVIYFPKSSGPNTFASHKIQYVSSIELNRIEFLTTPILDPMNNQYKQATALIIKSTNNNTSLINNITRIIQGKVHTIQYDDPNYTHDVPKLKL